MEPHYWFGRLLVSAVAGTADEMDPDMECNICDQFKPFSMMICLSETQAVKKKVQKEGGKKKSKRPTIHYKFENNLYVCMSVCLSVYAYVWTTC